MTLQKRRFWKTALGFGVVMAMLYFLELGKLALIVFAHVPTQATVMERHDSPGASFFFYKYSLGEQTFYGTKLYRYPENLFLKGLTEGQKFDNLVFSAYPEWSTPRTLILAEVSLSLLWFVLACLVALKALREVRKTP